MGEFDGSRAFFWSPAWAATAGTPPMGRYPCSIHEHYGESHGLPSLFFSLRVRIVPFPDGKGAPWQPLNIQV